MSKSRASVGGSMLRSMLVSALLALPMAAQAEGLLLNDIKSQNGVQLTVDELKQLMPNAKVVSYQKEGSTRYWTNEPDGKFVASSDIRRDVGLMMKGGARKSAQGTWHVGDNGTYCVTIDWGQRPENWCRYIFKVGGKYYGVKTVNDGATIAHEFEFSK
ncbi:MAG: DUF995 domain-containing protein [Rhodocyclaceae bacterium]|nr:DUF995 domain-containing protein [Rhodocyclaceae bacterium]